MRDKGRESGGREGEELCLHCLEGRGLEQRTGGDAGGDHGGLCLPVLDASGVQRQSGSARCSWRQGGRPPRRSARAGSNGGGGSFGAGVRRGRELGSTMAHAHARAAHVRSEVGEG
ncbi:Os11g0631900 [Oryza sativa Japonica Group]|uniref:Os11g0631900 protein n=1 Tax=Oryza sativa subsp. japonica TaxID=39947 RepID=Q0IRI2_ORYSJ|nr:Os11g0631900 [Oryza sativa Japonica Group]|eukprot:NP_001068320.1 Os11g0631900 [Oryza sativa Japonica Group]